MPRQRVKPVRPERLSQIEAKRPARLDLHMAQDRYLDEEASLADVRRAIAILEDVSAISNRFLGPDHPGTQKIQKHLDAAREKLARVA